MEPIEFSQANKTLSPPKGEYSENVESIGYLRVWTDGEQCVSLWRPSFKERLSILIFGKVWLSLLSGQTQPPAYIGGEREYFSQ